MNKHIEDWSSRCVGLLFPTIRSWCPMICVQYACQNSKPKNHKALAVTSVWYIGCNCSSNIVTFSTIYSLQSAPMSAKMHNTIFVSVVTSEYVSCSITRISAARKHSSKRWFFQGPYFQNGYTATKPYFLGHKTPPSMPPVLLWIYIINYSHIGSIKTLFPGKETIWGCPDPSHESKISLLNQRFHTLRRPETYPSPVESWNSIPVKRGILFGLQIAWVWPIFCVSFGWLVVSTHLKNMSQIGFIFPK